ncbi:MAG: 2-C-methyl-D-erythritol 4-phosphate cytidylyltransferase [Clostridia bacterium]|nr:2-C-methyl-D-erythritol 4-phosphate cytidylyltransferase [Clostridia bacterium]
MQTKTFELSYIKTADNNASVGVIIVAAGSASRMGGVNKILAPLMQKPVICHTIEAFNSHPLVSDIVLVTRNNMILDLQKITDQYGFLKVTDIIEGGNCREESVKKGFERLTKNPKIKTVLIHDGARPLVSEQVINRVINAAEEFSATVPAVPVKDTIKKVGALGKVEQTVDREGLVNIQTPQGFSVELFKSALQKAGDDLSRFTDDASIAEAASYSVYTVMGDYKNIKITTPEDIFLAEAYFKTIKGKF